MARDDEGQRHDRPADRRRHAQAAQEVVDPDQDDEHGLEDRREDPGQEADRIGAGLGRARGGGRAYDGIGTAEGRLRPRRVLPVAAQAATTRTTRARKAEERSGSMGSRRNVTVLCASLAAGTDRVIAAPAPWMAAAMPRTHPAPLQEPVLLDRLLRVARAGRLISAARRHPEAKDPVKPDHPDPDALHPVEPPGLPPLTRFGAELRPACPGRPRRSRAGR